MFRSQFPELNNFWIRTSPRRWDIPEVAWTDLGGGGLWVAGGKKFETLPPVPERNRDDLVYLPPVPARLLNDRNRIARELVDAGTAVLVQITPGREEDTAKIDPVYDLLPLFLTGNLDLVRSLEAGSTVVWPLIPGLADEPETRESVLDVLAERAVGLVVPFAVRLAATDRRILAPYVSDREYSRLQHGAAPSVRTLAQSIHRRGMAVLPDRSVSGRGGRLAENRKIASLLALCGELWLRLDRAEPAGSAFFRGARWIDQTRHDVRALTREGNLSILPWLSDESRSIVRDYVENGVSKLLEELRIEYLEGDVTDS